MRKRAEPDRLVSIRASRRCPHPRRGGTTGRLTWTERARGGGDNHVPMRLVVEADA